MASSEEEQLQKINQLRENLKDLLQPDHDDHYLLRWLRARNFDVHNTEVMYRRSMAWRVEVGADHILETYQEPEVLQKFYPGGVFGFDKEGSPLWIDPIGRVDIKGLMKAVKKDDIVRCMVYRIEKLFVTFREASQREGRVIDQCLHVVDMEGFSSKFMTKPVMDLYIGILTMLDSNYPETLKRTFVINAPKIFHMAFNVVKHFLADETIKKFVFTDHRWRERLLMDIDPSQLPVKWGGARKDPDGDPACPSILGAGGEVPRRYYTKHHINADVEDMQEANIARRDTLLLRYNIVEASAALRYVFSTGGKVIHFGIYKEREDDLVTCDVRGMEVVTPVRKVNCHREPEEGTVVCDTPGQYVLLFDNSSSWFTGVTLTYKVECLTVDSVHGKIDTNTLEAEERHTAPEDLNAAQKENHTASEEPHTAHKENHTASTELHAAHEAKHTTVEELQAARKENNTAPEERNTAAEELLAAHKEAHTTREKLHASLEERHTSLEKWRTSPQQRHAAPKERHKAPEVTSPIEGRVVRL